MIVKVQTWIYINVTGTDQAEEACQALAQLNAVISSGFPAGEVIDTDVDHYEEVSEEEVEERGLAEA